MTTHQQVLKTFEELVDLTARSQKISKSEAAIKVASENPEGYALYDRAFKEQVKTVTASRVTEPTAKLQPGKAEKELQEEVERAMAETGLGYPDALTKVCTERPGLYRAYDQEVKYRGARFVEQ